METWQETEANSFGDLGGQIPPPWHRVSHEVCHLFMLAAALSQRLLSEGMT